MWDFQTNLLAWCINHADTSWQHVIPILMFCSCQIVHCNTAHNVQKVSLKLVSEVLFQLQLYQWTSLCNYAITALILKFKSYISTVLFIIPVHFQTNNTGSQCYYIGWSTSALNYRKLNWKFDTDKCHTLAQYLSKSCGSNTLCPWLG